VTGDSLANRVGIDAQMRCGRCSAQTEAIQGNYKFSECGLPNVVLVNIGLIHCPACGNDDPVIPRYTYVMRLLTEAVVSKPYALRGEEIRFLRNRLRMTGDELAELLHIDRSNLSKWENNRERVGPQSDRLIRTVAVARADGLKEKLEQVVNSFPQIQTTAAAVSIEIDTKAWSYGYSREIETPSVSPAEQEATPIQAPMLIRSGHQAGEVNAITRRVGVRRLACALIGSRVAAAAMTSKVFRTTDMASVNESRPTLTRTEILSDLFKPSGTVACFAGDSRHLEQHHQVQWESWRGRGFPHDRAAVRKYVTLFDEAFETTDRDRKLDVAGQYNVLSTGSPHASDIARDYSPFWDDRKGTFSPGVFLDPSAIPFHFTILDKEGLRWSAGLGRVAPEALKAIRVGSKEFSLKNEPGQLLTSDFLLVTRLRKKSGRGYIILVAGGHGAGTQSFELLFDPKSFSDEQLRDLHRAIGGKECFQVAFKCSDLTHDGITLAHRIEVWDALEPVEIDPSKLTVPTKD
jgi:DNA-binding transcriptional regulator YiaG